MNRITSTQGGGREGEERSERGERGDGRPIYTRTPTFLTAWLAWREGGKGAGRRGDCGRKEGEEKERRTLGSER